MNSPISYPLDLTGKAPQNLVADEPHAIGVGARRAIAPIYGPFYTGNLVVIDAATNLPLERNTQYVAAQLLPDITHLTGHEICAVVVITDPTVSANVRLSYQVVGGDYCLAISAIQQLIDSLELDDRPIYWADVLGKLESYPALPHLHDIGDVYGFEYLVSALERLRTAILTGDHAQFEELRAWVESQLLTIRNNIQQLNGNLQSHLDDNDNPHVVTKAQIGLDRVQNFGIATASDLLPGAVIPGQPASYSNVAYMTPWSTRQMILEFGDISAHTSRIDNPHQVTKAQIGLSSVQNYPVATQLQAEQGLVNTAYMTPQRTSDAISLQARNPLIQHTNNYNNPHQTTKAHVGLGSVQDYPVATQAQALAGVNNAYMTPALTIAVIDARVGSGVGQHAGRTDNPHAVTKTQVGLGEVRNYGVASQAQAQAGADNATYMTPLRTAQAINTLAVGPLTASINGLQGQINQKYGSGDNLHAGYIEVSGAAGNYNRILGHASGMRIYSGPHTTARIYTFGHDGSFTAHHGRIFASDGFQKTSDRREKKEIKATAARPLWRVLDFSTWLMRDSGNVGRGFVAQSVLKQAPEYVVEADIGTKRKKMRLTVNTPDMALEMATAAGQEIDRLEAVVAQQNKLLAQLSQRLAALEAKRG